MNASRFPAAAVRGTVAALLALLFSGPDSALAACGRPPGTLAGTWCAVDGPHVRVWWTPTRTGAPEAQAEAVRDHVEQKAWPLFAQLLRRVPQSDANVRVGNGGDGRYDILLVGPSAITARYGESPLVSPSPRGAPARYSMVKAALPRPTLLIKVSHELMHGFLTGFRCQGSCRWLEEATATWAENLVDPAANTEHEYAGAVFADPSIALDDDTPGRPDHASGAYLFLLDIERRRGRGTIAAIWDATERTADPLAAIDLALSNGLAAAWRQFMIDNWNADPVGLGSPDPPYVTWDRLADGVERRHSFTARSVNLSGASVQTYPMTVDLPHLSAAYFAFDIQGLDVRSVRIDHHLQQLPPGAHAMAVFTKVKDRPWRLESPWTTTASNTFCLDRDAERVEKVLVMLGNGGTGGHVTFASGGAPPALVASTATCLAPTDPGYAECRLDFDYGPRYRHHEVQTWWTTGPRLPGNQYNYFWMVTGAGSSSVPGATGRWSVALPKPFFAQMELVIDQVPPVQVLRLPANASAQTAPNVVTVEDEQTGRMPSTTHQNQHEFWQTRTAPVGALRIEGTSTGSLQGAWAAGVYQPPSVVGIFTCRWSWPPVVP